MRYRGWRTSSHSRRHGSFSGHSTLSPEWRHGQILLLASILRMLADN